MKIILALLLISSTCFGRDLLEKVLYAGAKYEVKIPEQTVDSFIDYLLDFEGEQLVLRGDALSNIQEDANIILFFHGNAQSVYQADRLQLVLNERFPEKDFHVFCPQFPGYAGSELELSEDFYQRAGVLAHTFISESFPKSKIAIWGRSLGAGVATQVAFHTSSPFTNLVLVTPWANVYKLCHQRMGAIKFICDMYEIKEKHMFNTVEALPTLNVPITILHGTEDKAIAYENSQENMKSLIQAKRQFKDTLITKEGFGHNDIFTNDFIEELMNASLNSL